MEAAIKGALVRRATLYKDISSPLLAQLEVLAGQHGLDAKGIATAFDKFMTTSRAQSTSGVTPEDLEAFAEHFGKAGRQPDIQARPNNLFARGPSWEDATVGGLLGGSTSGSAATTAQPSQRISPYLSKQTPRPGSAAKPRTPASSGKFRERLQGGEVQAVLNSHIQAPAERMDVDAAGACCEVEVLGAALRADAKYMMNRIEDKVDHLERRLTGLEEALEARGLELTSVAYAAQDQTVFVGRVCCDTEEGRLNQESALLEGSVRSSQGARVRLDLSRCPTFRLFPGQVVAVKGTNPSGQCIVASEVVGGLPLPMPTTSLQQKAAHASATGKRGLSAVIAAGPFTSSEDLGYEALHALLAHCGRTRPDLLLLVGPFVDAEHPAVRGGLLEETFDEVFEGQVMGQLAAFIAANSGTRVMLMPAVRDVHHHPVFPQPPLPPSQGEPPVTNLPSPATVRCNEVVVGCSSADWLVACSGQEISRTAGQTDRLAALASHLISQRSYMPMFPPPASLPLDSANSPALELPCTPDLLVLPSDLQPFAKLVPLPATTLAAPVAEAAAAPALVAGAHAPSAGTEAAPMETDSAAAAGQQAGAGAPVRVGSEGSVVCINPGRLVKGTNGGTFAHVYIPPSPDALALLAGQPASTNSPLPHRVDQRCRVEIRKI